MKHEVDKNNRLGMVVGSWIHAGRPMYRVKFGAQILDVEESKIELEKLTESTKNLF